MSGQLLGHIVRRTPGLNDFGLGLWDGYRDKSQAARRRMLADSRAHLLGKGEDFERVCQWIQLNLDKQQRINRRHTSYGLKHLAEPDIGYCTNGLFIASMIACGFEYEECLPNCCFNVTTGSVRAAQRRAWGRR